MRGPEIYIPPTTTEYTRKGKGDPEKVAKQTKKKNRRDKKAKTTPDLMELMDDNFTIDLATRQAFQD